MVIHLAALNRTTIGTDIDSRIFHQVNVKGTRNLIHSCRYSKFIYISTAAVYSREREVITEESPIAPAGNYAKTKYEAELLCQSLIPEKKVNHSSPRQPYRCRAKEDRRSTRVL
uniref:NAD-dependent epimerase/dehydratase family protein n=1 Tax=Clostridium sp. NkU-1 TaxID=1095009 RepID=UPI0006D23859